MIENQKLNCWSTEDLNNKDFPYCIDSTNMRDQQSSTDPYRRFVGKAVGIFNADRVVNLDFSLFRVWAPASKK